MTAKHTEESFLRENKQLRERMEELEETLRAIGSGEIDALVVSGSDGEQIVTLKGALDVYRVMVEAMSNGAVTLAPDSTILYCNDYFAKMVGMPHHQVIGMPFAAIVAARDQNRFGKMMAQGTKRDASNELMLQAVGGKPVPAYVSMHTLPDSEGREIAVVVTDLAEVAAAAEARSRLALIVESSDDAIISITLEGVVQSWNRTAEKLFGYSAKESIGRDFRSLIVPRGYLDEVLQKFDIIKHGKPVRHLETERRRKDGSLLAVSVMASPIADATGRVVGASLNMRDITERALATEKIRDSEENFRTIFETVKDVIFILGPTGDFISISPSLQAITGFSPDEWVGKPFSRFVHPDDLARVQERLQEVLAGKSFDGTEVRVLKKSGDYLYSEFSADPRRYQGATQIIGVARDITVRKRSELALRQTSAELEEAQRVAHVGNWLLDVNTGAVTWSTEIYRIFGRDPMQLAPALDDHVQLLRPGSLARLNDAIEHTRESGEPFNLDLEIVRVDNSTGWIAARGEPVRDEMGPVSFLRGTAAEITDRKAAEARIKYLSRVHAMLSGINTLIVRVQDRDELFSGACRIAAEAGGFRMAVLCMVDRISNKIVPVATAGKDQQLLTRIKEVLASGEESSNTMLAQVLRSKMTMVSNDCANDPRLVFSWQHTEAGVCSLVILPLIVSEEAVGALMLYTDEVDFFHEEELTLLNELAGDVSFAIDHIEKQDKLSYLNYYDALTGLANRELFLERVAQYMRGAVGSGDKLALCLIDLERFRSINDSLGRPVGDALLKQVAEWLTSYTADVNLLARIEADHFAMVLPDIGQESDLIRVIEKMTQDFNEHPFQLNNTAFRIAAKVGIALFPGDGVDVDSLFKNADAALKKAKSGGDRYLFYKQNMNEAVAGKLTLENQLRQAIENEEFVLYYQPKVNLKNGKVTSAEALIRWNDPRTGLVPPGKFIPVLEETGLINEVGRWALHKAIADNQRWRKAGLPALRIAVNVSALQLHRHSFIAELEQALAVDSHAAEGLELEITESMIMDDIEHNIAGLEAIRSLGMTIAIDDFGTGFSSLSYLSKLPVDTLKIDRSFVTDMTEGPRGMALVSTIINLAHAFKLKVVAEGVETQEQSRLLSLLGCDEMQGFLFSKPVPGEIFETKFLPGASP